MERCRDSFVLSCACIYLSTFGIQTKVLEPKYRGKAPFIAVANVSSVPFFLKGFIFIAPEPSIPLGLRIVFVPKFNNFIYNKGRIEKRKEYIPLT
jgi:hypothetical protein